jgi:hypothetical protein
MPTEQGKRHISEWWVVQTMRRYNTSSEELWIDEQWSAHYLPSCLVLHSVWPTDANGNSSAILFGPTPDNNVGADEDDFHTFKRRTAQIEMEEKKLERVRQTIVAKAGAHSGVVQALGKPPVASKKIVYF